ncbi:MAG: uridine kinase [Bacteroidales bacterium]|jgi:uridine kinase|nr:uridine kinase [Bacteroidales bacterium]MBQ6081175.1 uridine kinase [Bacteroidales bacterium]MBQ7458209.1 uridine kinase [Bacteroidales bacterium]MBQ9529437.1 uridine kinase [Bacteroidales bacterium]
MLIIGIAGGSGSGKTTVVRRLQKTFKDRIVVIPQDSYYKDSGHLTEEEKKVYNFDHPNAIDFDLLCEQVEQIKKGQAIEQPVYSYITCERSKTETVHVEPADIILVEGILIFTCQKLMKQMDIKVFVDADDDDRLSRIMQRDIEERGKDVAAVIKRYNDLVKPMHLQFIAPSKRYADIIIPQGGHNHVAINILLATIEKALNDKTWLRK